MTGTNRSYGHVKREFVDACKRALLERELERRTGKERERERKERKAGRAESVESRSVVERVDGARSERRVKRWGSWRGLETAQHPNNVK